MKKWLIGIIVLISAAIGSVGAQDGKLVFFPAQPAFYTPFALDLYPGITIPAAGEADYFDLGAAVELEAAYRPYFLPLLAATVRGGYTVLPTEYGSKLSLLSAGAGPKIIIDFTPRLSTEIWFSGGYFHAQLQSGEGPAEGNPYLALGSRISCALSPLMSIGIGAGYNSYSGLYNGFSLTLGSSIRLTELGRRGGRSALPRVQLLSGESGFLDLGNVRFDDLFPMFYKYYDDHPVGRASLRNKTSRIVEDLEVTVFVKRYMDNPKRCQVPAQLNPRGEQEIALNALFTDRVLDITETTKVSAEILMEYTVAGTRYRQSHVETIRIYDRNAVTWDDDRKAAVFVTAKDPAVLNFSKNVVSITRDTGSSAINRNLRTAVAFFQSLASYGMSYVIDPTSPYKELSGNETAVDFLQFPRQTIQYRAGDCDDLTVLYASLLESVGIETALITVPGHIYMAFSLDLMPESARKAFDREEDLIYRDGRSWLPVEVTALQTGFIAAWESGARQWREAVKQDWQGFYPTHEAWHEYEPVGFAAAGDETIKLPQASAVIASYEHELRRFVDREIYPQIRSLEQRMQRYGESLALLNKLGVVYARYGRQDRAEHYFRQALSKNESYLPALLNMGNLGFLRGDLTAAKRYYEKAHRLEPKHPTVTLAVAKVHHDLGNYRTARNLYGNLKSMHPDLAERYAYLEMPEASTGRAAGIPTAREFVLWEE